MDLIQLAERRWIPDWAIRRGIRYLLRQRTASACPADQPQQSTAQFADLLRSAPLAVAADAANAQHYEVPAEFFRRVLGPRLKYSCCLYEKETKSLAAAEEAMLQLTCDRAEVADGQRILELGCGWGSLTLWMAEHYPQAQITAISNSHGQRQFIESEQQRRCLPNIRVITADMREFTTDETFDRVVSIEMFEHVRNYELLLHRISQWLAGDGKLFVHIFCHRSTPYLFETEGAANWMGRHFFTGGMMPAEALLAEFTDDLMVEQQWRVSGQHYAHTCEDWLQLLEAQHDEVLSIFAELIPSAEAKIAVQRWRMFFMACAELFRYRGGNEWFVGHYLMQHAANLARG